MNVKEAVFEILRDTVDEDAYRPGLVRTPERFQEAWDFYTKGYAVDPAAILTTFDEEDCGDDMIFQASIPFYSLCEHHLAPFFGVVHFAYIPKAQFEYKWPNGSWSDKIPPGPSIAFLTQQRRITSVKIVGLSKIPRLVEVFARRLQVQERMTSQIVNAFMEHVGPRGCGCVVRARHMCIESRGIQKSGTTTATSALRGLFLENASVREEFLSFVRTADAELKAL